MTIFVFGCNELEERGAEGVRVTSREQIHSSIRGD